MLINVSSYRLSVIVIPINHFRKWITKKEQTCVQFSIRFLWKHLCWVEKTYKKKEKMNLIPSIKKSEKKSRCLDLWPDCSIKLALRISSILEWNRQFPKAKIKVLTPKIWSRRTFSTLKHEFSINNHHGAEISVIWLVERRAVTWLILICC